MVTMATTGTNDLLDRYLAEVGRQLPKAERTDVTAELRSLLDETLAERAAEAPGGPSEDLTIAVLREFGRPEAVAERYGQPRRSLVGPAYYPAYVLVLKIVLSIVTLVYAGSFALWAGFGGTGSEHMLGALSAGSLDEAAGDIFAAFWGVAFDYVRTLLTNVGLVTLIFAATERAEPWPAEDEVAWDPRDLPRIEDPDRLDRNDLLFEIVILVAALLIFNLWLRWQGPLIAIDDGSITVIGRFTPAMLALVPWINGLWIAELALNLFVLARGRWNPGTRLLDIGINLASLVLLAVILRLPAIVDIAGLSSAVKIGLVVVWVIVAVELVQQVARFYRSVRARRA